MKKKLQTKGCERRARDVAAWGDSSSPGQKVLSWYAGGFEWPFSLRGSD